MHRTISLGRCTIAVILATILLTGPAAGLAQLPLPPLPLPSPTSATSSSLVGSASAARVSVLGILGTAMTTALADTGTLTSANNALDASMIAGGIPSTLSAETLSASTISWPNQVDSQASLGNLSMTVAGVGITADFVMAQASQVLGTPGSGSSSLTNLVINGTPIAVSGAPNQAISIPGGQVIINQQTISSTGAAVNALHVVVSGVADVVVASDPGTSGGNHVDLHRISRCTGAVVIAIRQGAAGIRGVRMGATSNGQYDHVARAVRSAGRKPTVPTTNFAGTVRAGSAPT